MADYFATNGTADIYGRRPTIQTSNSLGGNLSTIINTAIPGFSGLTGTATDIIKSALGGELSTATQNIIRNAAARQAVVGGMPGTNNISGSLYGNKTLRDLGVATEQRQQQGINELLALLSGYSGTVMPNFTQVQEQENARAKYAAAPDPTAAAKEQMRLFDKYSNPAIGTMNFGSGTNLGSDSLYKGSPNWLRFTSVGSI